MGDVLVGEDPFYPREDAQVKAEAASLERIGLSPAYAAGMARTFAHHDREGKQGQPGRR